MGTERLMRALRYWLAWWVVCEALWLLLTSTVSLNDVLTGFGAAALAAGAATLARGDRPAEWQRLPGVFGDIAMLPTRVLSDTVLVARAVVRRALGQEVTGRFIDVPVAQRGPAFEAVATALVSMSPNQFVVAFDETRMAATVHQLVARDAATLQEVLREP